MTERVTYEKAKEMMKEEKSLFFSIHRQEHLALHPKYIGDLKKGMTSTLDSLMSLYQERFDGVPLAYNKVQLLQNQANLISYQPYLHFDVTAEFIVFKPKVGCCLKGVIQKVESNHVSCLVHGVFNAWCPKKPLLHAMNEPDPATLIGCEIELTITKLSSNGGVLSMKGAFNKLIKKSTIMSDTGIMGTPNNQKKAFDDSESDEGKPLSPNTPALNHPFSPDLCSTQLPTPFVAPNKQRKRKLSINFDLDNSLDAIDRQQDVSEGNDSTSYTKVKTKKKKSKHEGEDVNGIEISSSMDNVMREGSVKKKKKKKEKHEKVEEVDGDEMNSSMDIVVTGGSAKKRKKKEKYEKVNGTDESISIDNIEVEARTKKKKKERHKEAYEAEMNSSMDNFVKEASFKKKKKKKSMKS